MDFFSAVADPTQPIIRNDRPIDDSNDSFAEAIASRFGSGALLTRLTPAALAPPPIRLPNSPMANMTLAMPLQPNITHNNNSSSPSTLSFTALTPTAIHEWIDDPTVLILDIRPHVAHSTARIPRAVSLSVPSTLLKRPLFSIQRLADMLPSANARARFSSWRSASRILVYDADSSSIPESSNIYGLLRKFKNDAFHGDLAWLKGGFQAVWRQRHDIIDTLPPTPDLENDDDDDDNATKASELKDRATVLRTKRLPLAAFDLSTTTVSGTSTSKVSAGTRDPLTRGASLLGSSTPSQNKPQPAFNPFFDAVRQNLELSQGITDRIPLRLPRRVRHRIHDLPFPWLREIARHAAKLAPHSRPSIDSTSSTSEESEDDENNTSADVEEGKEALAMQFFKIEVAEQRRLMGIMEHHSKETAVITANNISSQNINFPYSITAGVEKGAKNRYRHIWPFEHARVKLHQQKEADDNYVNASFIQPIGTNKRYIATQGPLPATFTDFWTLCWEQNVHVIIMLTKEVENSMVKCGSYWTDTTYGPLRLRMLSTTGVAPVAEEQSFFGSCPTPQRHQSLPGTQTKGQHDHRPSKHLPRRSTRTSETIRRVFELSHSAFPEARPRRIIHLQYLQWPDMNVPDDPRGILGLVKEVENAVNESAVFSDDCSDVTMEREIMEVDPKTGISRHALGKNRPVLLHCSAGVGRTGGFIAVDSVLDAIRREVRRGLHEQKLEETKGDDHAMDVDVDIHASATLSSVEDRNQPAEPSKHAQLPPLPVAQRAKSSDFALHIPNFRSPYQHEAPVQVDSEGTEPEASKSDRDIPPSSPLKAEPIISNLPPHEPNTISHINSTIITHETPNSSENSLLDLVNIYNKNGRCANLMGKYHLSKSSSLATSISSDIRSSASSFKNNSPSPPITRSVSSGASSENDISSGEALQEVNGDAQSNLRVVKHPSPRLGVSGRRRSSSPLTFNAIGDDDSSKFSKPRETATFSLHPAYTGGVSTSSDAETPSRSISPSADEGSVASQVSSYHTQLKNHHYQPLDPKALPTSRGKTKIGKDVKTVPTVIPNNEQFMLSQPTARPGSSSVNYKEPRVLHELSTPPSLSSFEEPICEVIQDMREQRMSLCQSLRQYVFVHAAILEGALMIVDEESERMKEKEGEREIEMISTNINTGSLGSEHDGDVRVSSNIVGSDETAMPAAGSGLRYTMDGSGLGPSNVAPVPTSTDRSEPLSMDIVQDTPPVLDFFSVWPKVTATQGFPPAVPSLRRPQHSPPSEGIFGKRSTSPTEYMRDRTTSNSLPVDSAGLLPKRPSVKRKQPSGEGEVRTRKRAQNESSSRERERDKDRESEWTSDGGVGAANLDGMVSRPVR